jgi:hypothetical protein
VVEFLKTHFQQNIFLNTLSKISDNICQDNGKEYIDFDKFKEPSCCADITKGLQSLSSVDSILINSDKNHIIFIEFKDMDTMGDFEDIKEWIKEKDCNIKIKIPDSILLLGYFLKENGYSFDEFMAVDKSFFYVYKSNSFKRKINNHLKYRFSKYNFILKYIKTMETQSYINFLEKESL